MGFPSETDRNMLVFCPMSLHVQFNLNSPHVDGGIVKVQGLFGVCSFDLLLDCIFKGVPQANSLYVSDPKALHHILVKVSK